MACSYHHTAVASELTDSVGYLRHGTAVFEEVYLNAVCREDVGSEFREFTGVVADVMTYGNRDLRLIFETFLQIVGETLCSCAYGVDVHTVGACAHDTAQTACAEFRSL